MRNTLKLALAAATISLASTASAQTLLTSSFGGAQATSIITACPSGYCFGAGPVAIGYNGYAVTYTATTSQSLLSGPGGGYGLGSNGNWYNVAYAATNTSNTSIFLTFAAPVTSVGGIMNYAPGYGTPFLNAYDASNTLIASYDLSVAAGGISTPGGTDAGMFRGVSYAGGISMIELQGGYALTQDLEAATATVPEPSTIVLMGAGMLGLVALRRRQRAK